MATKKRSGGKVKTFGAYLFKDKDPAIDGARTLLEDVYGRRVDYAMLKEVEASGGPSAGCMVGWFFKETRRPRNDTLEACGRSQGYRRAWVKMNSGKK